MRAGATLGNHTTRPYFIGFIGGIESDHIEGRNCFKACFALEGNICILPAPVFFTPGHARDPTWLCVLLRQHNYVEAPVTLGGRRLPVLRSYNTQSRDF